MAVPDETRRSLDRDADGFCRAFEAPVPTLSKTSEAPVVAVHDDGTVDVGYGGAVLTVRMTTACSGVAVGDTVLLTAYGQMLYATGVLARDNGHYVKVDQEQAISLGSNGAVTFRRIGGIVLVVFSGTVPGASGSWSRVSLGTLEEGLSPVSSTNVVLSSQGIASASRCEIGVDGEVYYVNSGLGSVTGETYMRGSSAYAAAIP